MALLPGSLRPTLTVSKPLKPRRDGLANPQRCVNPPHNNASAPPRRVDAPPSIGRSSPHLATCLVARPRRLFRKEAGRGRLVKNHDLGDKSGHVADVNQAALGGKRGKVFFKIAAIIGLVIALRKKF